MRRPRDDMWESVLKAHGLDPALTARAAPLLDDEFLESYVSWREAAATVQTAYGQWQAGDALAFAAYRAALDREEQAARELRKSAERISAESG